MDDDARRGLPALVEAARVIARALRAVEESLPPLNVLQPGHRVVARVLLREHAERIEAVLALIEAGLGQQAVVFVRPALDQMLWLRYLVTLPEEVRAELIELLGTVEMVSTLQAEQHWAGKKAMTRLGFPASFVNEAGRMRRDALARMRKLGTDLGWPEVDEKAATPVPNSHWVATKVERPKTYALLFAATSKPLHFSVSQAHSRLWGELDEPGTLDNEAYLGARTARSLHELLGCTPEIVDAVGTLCAEEFGAAAEIWDEDVEAFGGAFETVSGMGRQPQVHPAMFNLHKVNWASMLRNTERQRGKA